MSSSKPTAQPSDYDPTHKAESNRGRISNTSSTPAAVPPGVKDHPDDRYGKFVRHEKLGAGGMGEVWKAWDTGLGRWVALKFLKGGDEDYERFEKEARIAGKLSHPNIAAIFDVGQGHDRHYIAMQYVEGHTLKTFPVDDLKVVVRLIADASRAVAFANEKGVVHRDLKPENLMVTSRGTGKAERHHIYVMDFGLARAVEPGSEQSVSGTIVGTPSYMPPEQTRGERVDQRADVYSMGATLYQLATKQVPFRGANVFDTLRKVQEEDPVPPRVINSEVDADLETIILKCLDKDPDRRYATMNDLANDLQHYLDGEPVDARPMSFTYRLRRKLLKRKAVVGVALAGMLLIGVALGVLLPLLSKERKGKSDTERALQLWTEVSGLISNSEISARVGRLKAARERLDEGIALCRTSLQQTDVGHTHFFLAKLLRARGRRDEAEAELNRAVMLDPNLREARFERGLVFLDKYEDELELTKASLHRDNGYYMVSTERLHALNPRLNQLRDTASADLVTDIGETSYLRRVDLLYGRSNLQRDSYEKMGADMRRIIDQDPLYIPAYARLASMAFTESKYDTALEWLNQAVKVHQGYVEGFLYRSAIRDWKVFENPLDPMVSKWQEENLADATHAIELDDQCAKAYYYRAGYLLDRKDLAGSLRDCEAALKLRPDYCQVHIKAGYILRENKDLPGALKHFELAVKSDPMEPDGYNNRGLVRQAMGDPKGALEDYEHALKIVPFHESALLNRGDMRYEAGDVEGALRDFETILKANPYFYSAWANRGKLRLDHGDVQNAISDYREAVHLRPLDDVLHFGLGSALDAGGDFGGAMKSYNEAIRLNPNYAEAYHNRAGLKRSAGDWEGALKDEDAALTANPDFAEAHSNKGTILSDHGDPDGALREYDEAIRLKPDYPRAWAYRGDIKNHRGDHEGALKDLNEAIRLDTHNAEAYVRRGQVRSALDDDAGALLDFNAAIEIDPKMPEAYAMRGASKQNSGDVPGALADYQKALDLAPANWPNRAVIERWKEKLPK